MLARLVSCGSASLFAVDDSIRMTRLVPNERSGKGPNVLPVIYTMPRGLEIVPGENRPTAEQLACSLDGFSHEVASYLEAHLGPTDDAPSQWKLGVAFVQCPVEVLEDQALEIHVRPLAFRVTELFNRQIVRRRVTLTGNRPDPAPDLGNLYEVCARNILSKSDSFRFLCPSQLFIELALVTCDQYCLLVKKKSGPGVVAGIGRAWTCEPEYGLTISHLHENRYIRLDEAIRTALRKEFGVEEDKIFAMAH